MDSTKKPGRPKGKQKTGGRQKGTPNKVSGEIKDWIAGLVWRKQRQMEADLDAIDPKDRLIIMERLISYIVPKQSGVQAKVDIGRLSDEEVDMIVDEITKNLSDDD